MKKNDKLHIPIATEDKKLLKERAEKCRMSLTSYCIFILMTAKPEIEKYT